MFSIKLPYHKNAILDLFHFLSHEPWSMLLHSGYSSHIDARFDILVTSPILTITTINGISEIHYKNHCTTSSEDPFSLLKKEMKLFNMKPDKNIQVPFQGGYMGVFGYDLVRQIETLPKIAKKDINLPDMAIGLYQSAIIADHKLHTLQLISHDAKPKTLLLKLNDIALSKKNSFQIQAPWISNMTRKEYKKKFHIIRKHLKNGDCYQICLSQRFSTSYTGNEWTAFQHLLLNNYAPFSAFIRLPHHTILSLSPERFLHLQKNNIKTQPVKGTISRIKKNYQLDRQQAKLLSLSNKNQSENLMIVDLLRNDIGRIAIPGSVQVPQLFNIQTFPALYHMVSTVTGTLDNNYSAYELLRSCFPGGSVTGAPKIKAMEIIETLEPHRRNAWSGSIGYISCCGNMDTNIAIRTLLSENNKIFCSVGSGITYDSRENVEYQEMITKISTLLPLLNKPVQYHKKNIQDIIEKILKI